MGTDSNHYGIMNADIGDLAELSSPKVTFLKGVCLSPLCRKVGRSFDAPLRHLLECPKCGYVIIWKRVEKKQLTS